MKRILLLALLAFSCSKSDHPLEVQLADGEPGAPGKDGKDGEDFICPLSTIDGKLYFTCPGEDPTPVPEGTNPVTPGEDDGDDKDPVQGPVTGGTDPEPLEPTVDNCEVKIDLCGRIWLIQKHRKIIIRGAIRACGK